MRSVSSLAGRRQAVKLKGRINPLSVSVSCSARQYEIIPVVVYRVFPPVDEHGQIFDLPFGPDTRRPPRLAVLPVCRIPP